MDSFRQWLATIDAASLSDRERVDLVGELERVKGASSAVQARATDALRCSREVVAPRDVGRSVGSVVALARRESPRLGDRFVGLSRALVREMPYLMAALTEGEIGERVAVAVVAGTATLSREDRGEVDRRLGPVIARLGVKQAGRAATRVAAELDTASVVARMEAAVRSRRVTLRPAPDGMAYLSVLGPLKDVVGAHAAVQASARAVVSGQDRDELPEGRGVGAVAADTALRLLSGRAVGQPTPVEVHLVVTDRALLGSGDPGRSVSDPARVPGHGSVPAPVARAWLREGLDRPGDASARGGASPRGGALGAGGVSPAGGVGSVGVSTDEDRAARVWLRRLYTSPDGRDLVAMDSRRRVFGGMLRRMLVLRDDVCTTPWCEAPIVHADHATAVHDYGRTTFVEGNGKCARCNHTKEAPGWNTRVLAMDDTGAAGGNREHPQWPRDGDADRGRRSSADPDQDNGRRDRSAAPGDCARRVIRVTTPLGHRYDSEPPPLLGWGSSETTPPPATTWVHVSEVSTPVVVIEPIPAATATPKRPVGWPARQESASPTRQATRRRRTLRRARALRDPAPRRPRLTSHLERELGRYLT